MYKIVSKNHFINILIGVAFIAFFLITFFTGALEAWVPVVIGALVIIFSVLRFFRDYRYYSNDRALFILVVEIIVVLVLAGLMIFEELALATGLGLVFYLRGFVYMLIMQLLKKTAPFQKFIVSIAALTFGAYILFAGIPFLDRLELILLIVGLLLAGFYIFIGINQMTHQDHPKKSQKNQQQKKQ